MLITPVMEQVLLKAHRACVTSNLPLLGRHEFLSSMIQLVLAISVYNLSKKMKISFLSSKHYTQLLPLKQTIFQALYNFSYIPEMNSIKSTIPGHDLFDNIYDLYHNLHGSQIHL